MPPSDDASRTSESPMCYITPEHCVRTRLADRPPPDWSAGLLVFLGPGGSQLLLEAFDGLRPVMYPVLYNLTGPSLEPTVFEIDVADKTVVIVTRCVWGGPQAAILVEELASLGVQRILGFGACGSIDASLAKGSFVVAETALPTDGTSRAYGADAMLHADAPLVRAAQAAAERADAAMTPVTAATVDALYRETQELVDAMRGQGGQILNLETAALYAASAACGARSVWLGYVSDCLVDGQWDDWFADRGRADTVAARICRRVLEDVLLA